MSALTMASMAACSDNSGNNTANSLIEGNLSPQQRVETTTAVPADYFNEAGEKGTVEVLYYDSKDYTTSAQSPTRKPAYIYLPYGYDKSKRYDIIYLMHGWTGTAEEYFGMSDRQQLKNLFDNMIERNLCRPFIAVSPTWDKDDRAKGWSESTQEIAVFYNEYENDLIPAVESHYSTFARSTDRQGIIASRNHRAFGGFSLGSVTTWYIFENSFPLQRFFLPVSGDSWHEGMFGGANRPAQTAAWLASVVDNSQFKNDFHVWHAVGTSDVRYAQTHNQGMAMMELPEFAPETYSYHERPNGQHDMFSVWEFIYNALPEFFPLADTTMIDTAFYSVSSRVDDVMTDPLFGDWGRLIFPVNRNYWSGETLGNIRLTWYNYIDPNMTVEVINYLHAHAERGEQVFYNIYTDAERQADPSKQNTGLFFFRAQGQEQANRPFAICNAGGGFAYVGGIHDSYPHALQLSKMGYNAFALVYRPDAPYEDLARAITFIYDNADALKVKRDGYSLWGGSAGARMAATLGNKSNLRALTSRADIPQASAVVMQYTGYSTVSADDAPTYACVGTSDGIASWRTMQMRLQRLEALGISTEFHSYAGLPHGFGLGTGTVADGWINDAVRFWQQQGRLTGIGAIQAEHGAGKRDSIYGLNGLRRDSLARGINIVNGKKIYVK